MPASTLAFRPASSQPAGRNVERIRVTRVALDQDVVAGRDLREDRLGLGLADADVVERDVQDVGVLDQAVICDDRDAGVLGRLDGRAD